MSTQLSSLIVAGALMALTNKTALALTVPVAQDTSSSPVPGLPLSKQPPYGVLTSKDGRATSLTVADHRVALLDFDLSHLDVVPASITPGDITSALLRIYVIKTDPPGSLNVCAVTGTWSETFAASSEPLPTIDSTNVLATIPVGALPAATKEFVSVDITAAVVSALQSGSNLSLAIEAATTGAHVVIGSKDGPSVGYCAEIDIQAVQSTVSIGTVTSGTAPSVTIEGNAPDQTLNFILPADTLTIGTVISGTAPAVTLAGNAPDQILSLTLPTDLFTIGTVTSGTAPAVTLTGDAPNQSLNFTVPADTLSVGTVTSGTAPAVVLTGSAPNQTLNFTVPANTLSVGTVNSGTAAAVVLSGSGPNQTVNFTVPSNTLTVGTVATGTAAVVTVTGDAPNQSLDFTIPVNTLAVGAVTTGTTAAATLTGSAPNQVLNLTLPQPVIYGDGSAGNYTATSGTLAVSNPQFGNFMVPAGVTLYIPSGMTIRCSGSFTNLGTIIVFPAGGVSDLVDNVNVNPETQVTVYRGIAMTGAGAGNVSGLGGVAFPAAQLGTLTRISFVGGGSGGSLYSQSYSGITATYGGGACRIICSGPLLNSGVIDAVGANGSNAVSGFMNGGYDFGLPAGGGGGGGIFIMASASTIVQSGTVNASGGNGGNGLGDFKGGGGGGGGLIRILAPLVINTGQNIVAAGTDGNPITGSQCGAGGGASAGNGGDGFGDAGTAGLVLLDQCNPAALLGD
jgi:hypothetical protein